MRLALEQRRRIDFQRVAFDDLELAGEEGAEFLQRRDAAPVALHCGHAGAAFEQRPGQAAGTGADLEHLGAVQLARHLGDAGQQLVVEQEILPQRLAGAETVFADDFPERRKAGHAAASALRWAALAAILIAAIIAPGFAWSVPAMPKAVP
jgi:hypothetical protein